MRRQRRRRNRRRGCSLRRPPRRGSVGGVVGVHLECCAAALARRAPAPRAAVAAAPHEPAEHKLAGKGAARCVRGLTAGLADAPGRTCIRAPWPERRRRWTAVSPSRARLPLGTPSDGGLGSWLGMSDHANGDGLPRSAVARPVGRAHGCGRVSQPLRLLDGRLRGRARRGRGSLQLINHADLCGRQSCGGLSAPWWVGRGEVHGVCVRADEGKNTSASANEV